MKTQITNEDVQAVSDVVTEVVGTEGGLTAEMTIQIFHAAQRLAQLVFDRGVVSIDNLHLANPTQQFISLMVNR